MKLVEQFLSFIAEDLTVSIFLVFQRICQSNNSFIFINSLEYLLIKVIGVYRKCNSISHAKCYISTVYTESVKSLLGKFSFFAIKKLICNTYNLIYFLLLIMLFFSLPHFHCSYYVSCYMCFKYLYCTIIISTS